MKYKNADCGRPEVLLPASDLITPAPTRPKPKFNTNLSPSWSTKEAVSQEISEQLGAMTGKLSTIVANQVMEKIEEKMSPIPPNHSCTPTSTPTTSTPPSSSSTRKAFISTTPSGLYTLVTGSPGQQGDLVAGTHCHEPVAPANYHHHMVVDDCGNGTGPAKLVYMLVPDKECSSSSEEEEIHVKERKDTYIRGKKKRRKGDKRKYRN